MKYFLATLYILTYSLIGFSQTETQSSQDKIYNLLNTARELKKDLDYSEAVRVCNEALNLASEIKDFENEAIAHRILGEIYLDNKKYDDAYSSLQKAANKQSRYEFKEELAKTRNTLGLLHTEQGYYKQAENYFTSALDIYTSLQLFSSKTEVLKNIGKVYLNQKDYQKANETFEKAFKDASKYALEDTKADIYLQNAKALLGLGEISKAKADCIDAIDSGMANEYPWIVTEGHIVLSEIFEANNQIPEALNELKRHNKFRDSIFDLRKDRITASELAKFDFSEKEKFIEQQDLLIQKNQEQLRINRNLNLLGAAFLILFLTFILYLYNNNKKRKKANILLRDTNNQLTIAKDEAERASKAKAQFMSTVTHELRTPLYAVTGLTDLLLEQSPTQEQEQHLKSLRFSGDYLLNFINDMLDVNKIEANKIEIETIPFNLKKLSSNVLVTLNKAAEDNKTSLNLNIDESVPENVMGDKLRISQVLINLVSNAIKFTKNGKVDLNIKKLEQTNNTISLLLEVKDNGIGISYDKQELIFESFSQGSVQINRKYGGTGLGLTIVKNLLELMGSKIELKSEPGKGTNFYFKMNFEIAPDHAVTLEENNTEPEDFLETFKNKHILLVEDVKINQLITKKTLAKKEITCIAVDNGTEAINQAKENKFDLILMDIHMPGISGIEATTAIRKFDTQTPIIALTAITIDKRQQEEFDNAGFDDILSKPFKSDIFFNKVYNQLKK
ncbi:tetratricopeptide repeat-containing hybrid sensor histidine kinase/response regulator [Pseudofulvibacter geojedonensis]|uniref:histidine kinase n=1 Tax=Pseudofulvibacter geojedonensis TaxID=1123758 RepID=A0ABW3I513_9FLAO